MRQTSSENTPEGIKERYNDINVDMNVSKLSENIVFDPLSLTNEICTKISKPLKASKNILVLEWVGHGGEAHIKSYSLKWSKRYWRASQITTLSSGKNS